MRQFVRSKIHRVFITGGHLDYPGSDGKIQLNFTEVIIHEDNFHFTVKQNSLEV